MRNIARKIQSVEDARYFAERRLPKFLYQLYESGNGPARTVRNNMRAFDEVEFLPRAAVSHHQRALGVKLMGQALSLPVLTCPIGSLRTGAPGQGEVAVAKAATGAGTACVVSSFTGYPIEEIVRRASGPVFFQLFYLGGREKAERMVERAQRAGCAGLVVTVDIAAPGGRRERAYRDRVHVPRGRGPRDLAKAAPQMVFHLPWLRDFMRDGWPDRAAMVLDEHGEPMPTVDAVSGQLMEIPVWEDLSWLKSMWDGPLAIKGIMTPDDARRARDAGADAVFVSNHGGNHLDGSAPAIRMLPAIVDAVGGEVEIVLDGGVRRGTDVVKALALGADAVGLGRAYLYPLLAAGEAGVRRILELFREEIDATVASLGCGAVTDLGPSLLRVPPWWN